jgi:hypothetical protein
LRCGNAKTVILTLIGIVISHNSLQRVFTGERLSPDRMFEAYAGFTILERAAPEEPAIRQQPLDPASLAVSAK